MSENTKLDPQSLSAEERAIVDAFAINKHLDRIGGTWDALYSLSAQEAEGCILARRALFGTATEKAVDSCEKCGHVYGEKESGHLFRIDDDGTEHFSCQPAPPEPAAREMPEAVRVDHGELPPRTLKAGESVPYDTHRFLLWLARWEPNSNLRGQLLDWADALESWWRTHSQPVAHPFKAGFKPDSMRHFAEYVRDNWHYFGTDTAGLAHQFVQEMDSQPVAVGMTEELSMVLLRAEYGATEDERNPNLRDGYVARLKSAIETVRQQAAQVKL